jgi:hypothetical protein
MGENPMKFKEFLALKWEEFNQKRFFEKELLLKHTDQIQRLGQRVLKLERAVFKSENSGKR